MCGIGGIFLRPGSCLNLRENLEKIIEKQNHRGPDANGVWLCAEDGIGLSHNRLSILDLSDAGNQPMLSRDGRYVVVFNGEIYNYLDLKRELGSAGSAFATSTDTEVLIEAYRRWGEDMLTRLRGMFAFAIYDRESLTLFCARDRVGKKPFVYSQVRNAFVFASEIPAVRLVEGVDAACDHDALAAMLLHNLRHIPDPHTAYAGIKRLRAGHAMIVRAGSVVRIWRYWSPQPSTGPVDSQHLRALVEDAVNLRMQADVPVGALLSGGVDSSAIVALMQMKSQTPVHTYALGLDQYDEDIGRARVMAAHLGTQHHEYFFDTEEQWGIFKQLIQVYGEPIMLLPLVHTYALCRAIRDDGIKVVLTGNGADELFYGYTGHIRTLKISRWLDRMAPFRTLMAPLKGSRFGWVVAKPGQRKAAYYQALEQSEWAHCLSKDAISTLSNRAAEEMLYWGGLCPSDHFIDESNFVGLMVENPHSVTIAGDLPAMAASVEIRSPFLDQDLVSFALATPAEQKIPDLKNPAWLKAILRDAVQDLVPEYLLKAPKRGFGSGIQEADILRGVWREKAASYLDAPNTAQGFFSEEAIRKNWCSFLDGGIPAISVAKQLAIQVWLCQEKI